MKSNLSDYKDFNLYQMISYANSYIEYDDKDLNKLVLKETSAQKYEREQKEAEENRKKINQEISEKMKNGTRINMKIFPDCRANINYVETNSKMKGHGKKYRK